MFDLMSAADAAVTVTLNALLHPARAARLVEQRRRDPAALGFADVLNAVDAKVFAATATPGGLELANVAQTRFVSTLMELSLDENAAPAARAISEAKLRAIAGRLGPSLFGAAPSREHNAWLQAHIDAHLKRPAAPAAQAAPAAEVPPGPPIGGGSAGMMETCWHCED
jgi:hypothetical protein